MEGTVFSVIIMWAVVVFHGFCISSLSKRIEKLEEEKNR